MSTDYVKCPRCEGQWIGDGVGALSRVTGDDGAPVTICNRCAERELLYGLDAAEQIPVAKWPVEIETLLTEEKILLRRMRGSTLEVIPADELELGEGEDGESA